MYVWNMVVYDKKVRLDQINHKILFKIFDKI